MAPHIYLKNRPSHSSRNAAAFSTGFGMKQETVPDIFSDNIINGLKEDTDKAAAVHVKKGGLR